MDSWKVETEGEEMIKAGDIVFSRVLIGVSDNYFFKVDLVDGERIRVIDPDEKEVWIRYDDYSVVDNA